MTAGDRFAGQSIETARRILTNLLGTQRIDSAELDARLLTGAVLGLDLTGLISAAKRILTSNEAAQLARFAQRRIDGEPVARILGAKEFWGLPLQLSADTLVPRPDTETIVEATLELLDTNGRRDRPLIIADLGTGSGAILLALLSELPNATGIATDINLDALRTARSNAAQLGLIERAHFIVCDYASALTGDFDLIVSNPPYIPSADIAGLDIEVRKHDPLRALDGGKDGLDAYRVIAPEAARLLVPGGLLVVEVGHDQSDDVTRLVAISGLALPAPPKADLEGIRRAVSGQKKP
ncbi:peptide chain release factor N(5)-glutamine methyltransferase [Tardiphaga sp. P9-11]|uniref:peptide chain release factor N(5)-glutamine methyltransferase n=1 Tax=Tardiphaga sp. P9-11 TaxID=2024614 RepID=UPI0011F33493|nr:peptide chain release factor N(5)-glutamine methyltransferase [Tardiphaga sp. P9-11]KAA0078287.1 peptide chain release factor N(5)-glutamine methyltransferase [Tardiphaga sp. P9-11]